jgi:hypothetical protein
LDRLFLRDSAGPATEASPTSSLTLLSEDPMLLTGLLRPIAGHRPFHDFLPFLLNDQKSDAHFCSFLRAAARLLPSFDSA